ncbi:hypothetical protein BJX76DRAFT_359517 [Aspergillus varians]
MAASTTITATETTATTATTTTSSSTSTTLSTASPSEASTSAASFLTPWPIQTDMVGDCAAFYLLISGDYNISFTNFYVWNPAAGDNLGRTCFVRDVVSSGNRSCGWLRFRAEPLPYFKPIGLYPCLPVERLVTLRTPFSPDIGPTMALWRLARLLAK